MTEKYYTESSPFPPLTPGKMRIYSMRFCPFAERTRLVLCHKNIAFETVNVDLKKKPSWFLERNPNGTVPVLEHDGKVLYESLVTSDYLDDIYPENKLTPADPYQRSLDRLLIDLFSKMMSKWYRFTRDGYGDEDVKAYFEAFDKVEKAFSERKTRFLSGNSVQMVDLMLWPYAERFDTLTTRVPEIALSPERYPAFTKWMENMSEVPAVKKCRMDTATHLHFVKSSKEGKPDYDYGL